MRNPFVISINTLDNNPCIKDYYKELKKFKIIKNQLKEFKGDKNTPDYFRLENEYNRCINHVNATVEQAKKYEKKLQSKNNFSLHIEQENSRKKQYQNLGLGNSLYISA